MASYTCDYCQVEPAEVTVSQHSDGSTQFIGPSCLPLLGFALIGNLDPDLLDAGLKPLGYQPTKALRDQRKALVAPEVDPGRTIAEIVETGPRPEGDGQADDADTPPADEPAGSGATPDDVSLIECKGCGAFVQGAQMAEHVAAEHPDVPSF